MLLSIITINLNNEEGLRKTISSVLDQTFTDFEYIIIDGGSTDGSLQILQHYSDKLKYWSSEPDGGIYNAMNKGIRVSTGEYLQFLNSGDYFKDELVLQKLFSCQYNEGIINTNGFNKDRKGELHKFVAPEKISLLFLLETRICHAAAFISKKIFQNIGLYNENNKIVSDAEFFLKAYLEGVVFHKADVNSVIIEPGGISKTNVVMLYKEIDNIILNYIGEEFLHLYKDRQLLINQLSFLNRSSLIRFLLKHRGNFFINRLIRLL
jgi:glycosyltransferase involved in cell wall biosynthesis